MLNCFYSCIFVFEISWWVFKIYKTSMKKLSRAEEEVMHILWDMGQGFVRDVIDHMPNPKPPYNTISTIIRVLEKKDFLSHRQYGNTYEYFPLVSRDEYARVYFNSFLKGYFHNSFSKMAAFFIRENNLSLKELDEIMRLREKELKKNPKDPK